MKEELTGLLVIDKPQGVTSRDVVNRVQSALKVKRCGHAGTLDPLATGVLVVCVGRATRLVSFVQQMKKYYRGSFRFGLTSDTDDIEGEVQEVSHFALPERSLVEDALNSFVGNIQQVPPKYSAVMVSGKRAYDLARQGKKFELQAREVQIERVELLEYNPPDWTIDLECGSGTYVRSLGRDLGEQFGCGAVMTALRRTAIGSFRAEQAISWEELLRPDLSQRLRPSRDAVSHLPVLNVDDQTSKLLCHGRKIVFPELVHSDYSEVAVLDPSHQLICVAHREESGLLKPKIVLQSNAGNE